MANKNQFTVQIDGWEELEAKLRDIGATINTGDLLEEALMEGGEIVRAAVQSQAPARTGQLAGSIAISKQGREKHSIRIGPSGAGFYGRFLEYGTSKMPAQPFVRPGFDAAYSEAQQAINEAIWKKVERAATS